jgi:hypothetical protein
MISSASGMLRLVASTLPGAAFVDFMSFFSVYCAIRPQDGIFSGRYFGLVLELLCVLQRGQ